MDLSYERAEHFFVELDTSMRGTLRFTYVPGARLLSADVTCLGRHRRVRLTILLRRSCPRVLRATGNLAEHLGLEPRTYRLTADCSAIELMFQNLVTFYKRRTR